MTEVWSIGGQQEVTSTSAKKTSLLISPNLDALLEHDERTRRQANDVKSPDAFSSSSAPDVFLGLPPPPRGPRKTSLRSRNRSSITRQPRLRTTSQATTDSDASDVSTPVSNPFINPAPTLDTILNADDSTISPSISASLAPDDNYPRSPGSPIVTVERDEPSATKLRPPSEQRRPKTSESSHSADAPQLAHHSLSLLKSKLGLFADAAPNKTTDSPVDAESRSKHRKKGKLVKSCEFFYFVVAIGY